jgi:hypothetical protein
MHNLPRYATPAALLGAVAFFSIAHAQISSSSLAVPITGNVINTAGDITSTLGGTTFINHGLQGVGRVSASSLDAFGDTLGSVSGLVITDWSANGSSYSGVFNILPDRGFNVGTLFADYAGRINQFDFTFTPYTSVNNIGGTTTASKAAAQNQIQATYSGGVKFTYDSTTSTGLNTTGLNPVVGTSGVLTTASFSNNLPGASLSAGTNKLSLDSEALVLKADGSGYIGDEYGSNIYHFDANEKIDAVLAVPDALKPRANTAGNPPDFDAVNPPLDGRRNNQGFEGVSLSPDGKKLFVLAQSATVQDSGSGAQGRLNTRMLVYDVSTTAVPSSASAEYVLQLPILNDGTDGNVPSANNKTAAQSEIIALDDHRILVLSRDSNGANIQGVNGVTNVPPKFKSVLLVDLNVAGSDILNLAGVNGAGEKITQSGTTLKAGITPVSWTEALNLLNLADLNKFNIRTDNYSTPDILTMSEKWEGMSLVSALDPNNPNDYFLFVANDNDFITADGHMLLSDGSTTFNATGGAPGSWENDTMFLAYRVTITPGIIPEPSTYATILGAGALGLTWLRRRKTAQT